MNEEIKGFRNFLEKKVENLIGHGTFETMTNIIMIIRWKKSSSVEDRFNQNIEKCTKHGWCCCCCWLVEDDWRRLKSCFQMNAIYISNRWIIYFIFKKWKSSRLLWSNGWIFEFAWHPCVAVGWKQKLHFLHFSHFPSKEPKTENRNDVHNSNLESFTIHNDTLNVWMFVEWSLSEWMQSLAGLCLLQCSSKYIIIIDLFIFLLFHIFEWKFENIAFHRCHYSFHYGLGYSTAFGRTLAVH